MTSDIGRMTRQDSSHYSIKVSTLETNLRRCTEFNYSYISGGCNNPPFFLPNYLIKCSIYGYNVNMKTTTKTPYELVISEFGGVRALGRAISKDPSAISKWGRRHGCIPATEQK